MADVWGKLNLKDQKEIVVVNAPPSFQPEIEALDGVTVKRTPEPVRLVAIDEDWSAKRFRRAEFIKTMTRPEEWRFSKAGKAKK